jgi:serine/threonine protein kinase
MPLEFCRASAWVLTVQREGTIESIGSGRYSIDRQIGVGGGGAVYLAFDQHLQRWVALKRVNMDSPETPSKSTSAFREATQLAQLQHPNIVIIYDFLEDAGDVFVVMEYFPGQNMEQITEPMQADMFMDFATQCLEGLSAAHSIGMVHRDIKPSNIMIAGLPSGGIQVKLLDFGLAKILQEPSLQTLDHSGGLMGSIYVVAPEQLNRHPIDARTDLYSLGCVFYQALTRQMPFRGGSVPAIITAHLQHDFVPLSQTATDLAAPLAAWVERLFAFNIDDRPTSALAALGELKDLKKPSPTKSPAMTKPTLARSSVAALPKNKVPSPSTDSIAPGEKPPFYKSVPFALIMAALGAAGATVLLLVFTGMLGTPKNPAFALKKKPQQAATPEQRKDFDATERSGIKAMEGKAITISGEVAKFEEDQKGRYLTFQKAGHRDAMVYFDTTKGEFPKFRLVKFQGKKIRATGVVRSVDNRVLVEVDSIDKVKLLTNSSDTTAEKPQH